jgi:hypothetical protein
VQVPALSPPNITPSGWFDLRLILICGTSLGVASTRKRRTSAASARRCCQRLATMRESGACLMYSTKELGLLS